jgi:hypothetical protein
MAGNLLRRISNQAVAISRIEIYPERVDSALRRRPLFYKIFP